MSTLRLRLKNLKTLYSLRPSDAPEYARLIEQVARVPYEIVQQEIATVLAAHMGDIPVQAVRDLGLTLTAITLQKPELPADLAAKGGTAEEFAKLGILYMHEVLFGAATALSLLADLFDPNRVNSEEDLEEWLARQHQQDDPDATDEP